MDIDDKDKDCGRVEEGQVVVRKMVSKEEDRCWIINGDRL